MTPEEAAAQASSIKKIVIGSIVAEYGALELLGQTKQELKHRVKNIIKSSKDLQNYFIGNRNASPETIAAFRQEFHKDEIFLLSELLLLLWGVSPEDIEEITATLKEHIQEPV